MWASLRVDSIKGGVDPRRKIQNIKISYASLGVNSNIGCVDLDWNNRMLFLFCAYEESTLEEVESTLAQEGSTPAIKEPTLVLLTHFNN